MSDPRRVLMVLYQFPPVGGAGVQRSVKFVKYLPQFGWQPTVLTVENPSVPVLDKSLEADIPPGTEIRRCRTLEPGYAVKAAVSAGGENARPGGVGVSVRRAVKGMTRRVANLALQPDPQILWMPGAVREGMRILRETPHVAIMASGPPFSSFLIAAKLSRLSGLPLVVDYRDEWGLSNAYFENKRPDAFSNAVQTRMQAGVARRARVLLATTAASAEALTRIRDKSGSTAEVAYIYNGYDPDDFRDEPARSPASSDFYRLSYVGTLWKVMDCGALVDAVLELSRRRPDLAAKLELNFAGRRTAQQDAHLARLEGSPCRRNLHAYLDHNEAVELARSSDSLCVLMADLPGTSRFVPAKLFEAMAARLPILVIAPRGEVWDLLERHPAAARFVPDDVNSIADYLAAEIERKQSGKSPEFGEWDPSGFDRRQLTRQLAELFDRIAPRDHP